MEAWREAFHFVCTRSGGSAALMSNEAERALWFSGRSLAELMVTNRRIPLNFREKTEKAAHKCYCSFNKQMNPLWRGSGCSCRWYRRGPMGSMIYSNNKRQVWLTLGNLSFERERLKN